MRFPGRIEKDGGWWRVEIPAFDALTQGRTKREALAMVKDLVETMAHSKGLGVLVAVKNTKPITAGTITEFVTIVLALIIFINYLDVVGAVAATIAFVAGRIVSNIYLTPSTLRSTK